MECLGSLLGQDTRHELSLFQTLFLHLRSTKRVLGRVLLYLLYYKTWLNVIG